MSFFQRVVHHLVNEVLVSGLANSPTFQRFAVRSNAMAQELAKKSAAQQAELSKTASSFAETFKQEVKKGLDEVAKQQQPPPKGGGSGGL